MRSTDHPGRWVLVRYGVVLAGCLVLSAYLTPPSTATPRAAATPLPDTPTTQTTPGTAPVPTTSTDTTSPGTATGAGAATNAHADTAGADAALGDAVVLTRALEGRDYAALAQVVGERVAPRVGGGAYATALVDALGARGVVRVAVHLPVGESGAVGAGTENTSLACVWTSLLATATTSPLRPRDPSRADRLGAAAHRRHRPPSLRLLPHLPAPRPTALAAPTRKTTQTPGTTPSPGPGRVTTTGWLGHQAQSPFPDLPDRGQYLGHARRPQDARPTDQEAGRDLLTPQAHREEG